MRQDKLENERLRIALATLGYSHKVIYKLILNLVESQGIGGNVLDFGAGMGYLSKLLSETDRFSEITAIDLVKYPDAAEDPKIKWILCDLNERLPISSEVFDAVVVCEVIEHLENARFLAREWFRVLKPGGVLIISTPNQESWRSILALILRGQHSYPAHLIALLRSDIERILSEAGFGQIEFSYSNFGTIPTLPTKSWQSISCGALRGVRFSDSVLCTAQKPI